MHALIVDDEPLARNELSYLLKQTDEISAIEEADSIEEALEKLLQEKIDIAFLDIHLTEESGLTLADKMNRMTNPPIIVFATAYDEYAIEAFERDARDYLLKPFEQKRVKQTVQRAKAILSGKEKKTKETTKEAAEVFPVQMDDRIYMVKVEEILAIEVNQGETTVYTEEKEYKTTDPLTAWEEKLPNPPFMRVHRSYLVNLDKIIEIQPWFNQTYQLTIKNDLKIPVSRSYVQLFKKQIGLTKT
ncbi:MAG TPA: LytTR family transcriptional regulator DNA-binding domain-containing protein [Atopostipes sp.]|nr:LytTR family transcriptional regulator DNA-binding domain-containing protein [Atopostipes sp.]